MTEQKKVASLESDAANMDFTRKPSKSITRRSALVKRKLLELAFRIVISAMASVAVASWVVPAAYAERGYSAVGGEWLLVIVTFVAVMFFTGEHEWR